MMPNQRQKKTYILDDERCSCCSAELQAHSEVGWDLDVNGKEVYFCHAHTPPHSHINVYTVDRLYGGPEEGGWWYNAYSPVASVCIDEWTDEDVHILKGLLEKNFSNEGRIPLCSVNSEGEYFIAFEDCPAEPSPKRRPIYE
jgi:hypothetical protein